MNRTCTTACQAIGKAPAKADARKAEASVPKMGVAATNGRFDGMETRATGKICQSGSLKVSYWENRGWVRRWLSHRTPLKTLRFRPEGHLTSVTWASGPQSAIVQASWSSNQNG